MPSITLARHAMATRFELLLHGEDPVQLRAAGEEAMDEIDRLERQLSLYRPDSELADVNRRSAHEPVKVTPSLFRVLMQAKACASQTEGAFDITVAPLVRCWGFMGGSGEMPDAESVQAARELVGMHLLELDERSMSVRFRKEGVMLDLGAIGKGYAIEKACECLREAGIESALLHGGTSSIYAIGAPGDAEAWKVAIENPPVPDQAPLTTASVSQQPRYLGAYNSDERPIATVCLRDESLSVSAVWGKSFMADGRKYGHVLDPRSGQPTAAALLSAIVLPSATEADALSTALLTLGTDGLKKIGELHPDVRALVLYEREGTARRAVIGEWDG